MLKSFLKSSLTLRGPNFLAISLEIAADKPGKKIQNKDRHLVNILPIALEIRLNSSYHVQRMPCEV